ncbi:MAG: hypothetical protein DRJ03_11495 [Chloroflexi bacterium]|nr:MAG: hypothetical protein DRJ03_11495 [Chloroflexota bacterium]
MVVNAVIAGVAAVANIAGGIASSNAAKAEAERASQYASYNAGQQVSQAQTQAQYVMIAAMFNANQASQQASYNATQNKAWIDYNNEMSLAVDEYNSLLYEDQVSQILEASSFDKFQITRSSNHARGDMIAQQGASGTTVGVGTNRDAVIEHMAEEELMKFVVDHNAVNAVNSIRNADALGQWEGSMARQKMTYEGQLATASMMYNVGAANIGNLMSATMSASQITQSGQNQATSTLLTGQQTSDNQNAQASLYMTQGILDGTKHAVSAYSPSTNEPDVVPWQGAGTSSLLYEPTGFTYKNEVYA